MMIFMWPANLRVAVRSLLRNPVITAAAVLSLALAIGANTALFSVTDQMLLRMLPVRDPQRLVMFKWAGEFIGGRSQGLYDSFSYPAYADLRDSAPRAFAGIAAQYQDTADLAASGPAQRAVVELVSGNYFSVLGVGPAVGRVLAPSDGKLEGSEPYLVLSYGYWQRRFAGDPGVLNKTVNLNGHPLTVVGIARKGFAGLDEASPSDVFVPMMMKATVTPTWNDLGRRNSIWLHIFGRLKPGITQQKAAAAMAIPFHRVLEGDLDATGRPADFRQLYLRDTLSFSEAAKGIRSFQQRFAKPLYVLLGMVGMLLLIACVNIANLFLTRATARGRETGIRLALGASRLSLMAMSLTESLLVAASGGLLGLAVSAWLTGLLVGFLPYDNMAAAIQSSPDLRVLGFAAALTMLTALIFGLIPAWQSTRGDVAATLKAGSLSMSTGGTQKRFRHLLVSAQVAFSLVLIFAAGLFARSLHRLLTSSSGMNTANVVQFSIDPSLHRYSPQRSRQLFEQLQERIRQLPDVSAVSAAGVPVLAGEDWQNTVHVQGYQAHGNEDMNPGANQFLPEFFTAMGVPLLSGRDFAEGDAAGKPKVAIVNGEFVKRFVPDGKAVGRHFGWGGGPMEYEIVGVVADMKGGDLRETPKPYTYTALLQEDKPASATFYVRTKGSTSTVVKEIRERLRELDAALPMNDVETLVRQIDKTQFTDRLFAWLSSAFGALAILLAAIGLYGVTAYSVTRRTREIGIRVALGAERSRVFSMVMREVFWMTATGLIVGAPLLYWVGKIAASELFGIAPYDGLVLAGAVFTLLGVSVIAGWLPARRAMRVDPMQALRHE